MVGFMENIGIKVTCHFTHIRWDPEHRHIDYWCKNCGWSENVFDRTGAEHRDMVREIKGNPNIQEYREYWPWSK